MTLREAMVFAGAMGASSPWPENYRWVAVWWRLHARESAAPAEPRQWARAQLALYRDIQARPEHYRAKPAGITDWMWSGLSLAADGS